MSCALWWAGKNMASAFRRLTVVSRTFILALLGIPTTYWFNSMKSMSNHWVIFWGSNAILAAVVLFVYLFPPTESDSPARKDPFLYGLIFFHSLLLTICTFSSTCTQRSLSFAILLLSTYASVLNYMVGSATPCYSISKK